MADVGAGLGQIQGPEVEPDPDPLPKRLVDGEAQGPTQLGMPDEDQGCGGLEVHPHVEEQAQLFEHPLIQQVGLIDDEDRRLLALVEQHVVWFDLERSTATDLAK
jgi:hypothetical protein